jgi:hypothetical protein
MALLLISFLQQPGRVLAAGGAVDREVSLPAPGLERLDIDQDFFREHSPGDEIIQGLFGYDPPFLEGGFKFVRVGGDFQQPGPLFGFVPGDGKFQLLDLL